MRIRAYPRSALLAMIVVVMPLCMCSRSQPPTAQDDDGHDHGDSTVEAAAHSHEDGTVHVDGDTAGTSASAVAAESSDNAEAEARNRLAQQFVHMHQEEADKYGILTDIVQAARLADRIKVNGEINVNKDTMAHIVPRLPGIVTKVRVTLGDTVKKGQVLAEVDSLVLADAKAEYLACLERKDLAQAVFDREQRLLQDKVTSEQEYLDAKQALAEVGISLRSSKQKLLAMGLSQQVLARLTREEEASLTRYQITAPFAGTIITKHIVLGEVLQDDSDILVIADLDTVWLDLQVHQKDLARVRVGQSVRLAPLLDRETSGIISYLGPLVGTDTRTALARVVLPNLHGDFRPGLFVQAEIAGGGQRSVVVEKDHIQYIEDIPCVFVPGSGGFAPRPVALGAADDRFVAVLSGLTTGERIVTANAFYLKAELTKASGDAHAGHSHGAGDSH